VAAFCFVTALVIALFNFLDRLVVASAAMVVAAGCGICMVLLRRAKTWIRFSRFDHRSHTFKARRREYAQELAELNGGRIA
jgi:type II secretory pathway component PulF